MSWDKTAAAKRKCTFREWKLVSVKKVIQIQNVVSHPFLTDIFRFLSKEHFTTDYRSLESQQEERNPCQNLKGWGPYNKNINAENCLKHKENNAEKPYTNLT